MNSYITGGTSLDAPPAPATMAAGDTARLVKIPVLRTRGYEDSLEHTFPAAPAPQKGVSCCEDVGTAYLLNLRWLDSFATAQGVTDAASQVKAGLPALTAAIGRIQTNRFAWFTDQTGEAMPRVTTPNFEWNNAFDDDDQSVMGFLDGHVGYIKIEAGHTSGKDFTFLIEQ